MLFDTIGKAKKKTFIFCNAVKPNLKGAKMIFVGLKMLATLHKMYFFFVSFVDFQTSDDIHWIQKKNTDIILSTEKKLIKNKRDFLSKNITKLYNQIYLFIYKCGFLSFSLWLL